MKVLLYDCYDMENKNPVEGEISEREGKIVVSALGKTESIAYWESNGWKIVYPEITMDIGQRRKYINEGFKRIFDNDNAVNKICDILNDMLQNEDGDIWLTPKDVATIAGIVAYSLCDDMTDFCGEKAGDDAFWDSKYCGELVKMAFDEVKETAIPEKLNTEQLKDNEKIYIEIRSC
jgi:hypothetical protein